MNAQIKKGILELCILFFLSQQDDYGYPLMQKMKIHFPDVEASTIYAVLRRLKKEGLANTYTGKESYGPDRKYYHITGEGKERLKQNLADWNQINRILKEMGI